MLKITNNKNFPVELDNKKVKQVKPKQDERKQEITEFRIFKYAGKNISREDIEKIVREKKLVKEKEIYEKARIELVQEGTIVDTKPVDNSKVIKLIEQALELLK